MSRLMMELGAAVLAAAFACGFASAQTTPTPENLISRACPWEHEQISAIVQKAIGTPSNCDIDSHVFGIMKASNVHGASLAIVQGTRLVYAKGYSFGPTGTQIIQPTTYFRQASVSKLFTALAIVQLLNEQKISLSDTAFDRLFLSPGANTPLHAPHSTDKPAPFEKITIEELLNMNSGLPETVVLPPSDAVIAKFMGTSLPLKRNDMINFFLRLPLKYPPGEAGKAAYVNDNYMLLGYIVAAARGADSFIDAIRGPLLAPLAITRVRDSVPLFKNQLPDEALYYPKPLSATVNSVMSPNQPTVVLGYGEVNYAITEGSGGLSAATTDVARLLAALSVKSDPTFNGAAIHNWQAIAEQELSSAAASYQNSALKGGWGFYGWDSMQQISFAGAPPYIGYKGGKLWTSQNAIYFQQNGISYVLNWNSLVPAGEAWWPRFKSVIAAAESTDWGNADHFPDYGMPSFPTDSSVATPPVPTQQR